MPAQQETTPEPEKGPLQTSISSVAPVTHEINLTQMVSEQLVIDSLRVGDVILIEGEENPSTGYSWEMRHFDLTETPIYKMVIDEHYNEYYATFNRDKNIEEREQWEETTFNADGVWESGSAAIDEVMVASEDAQIWGSPDFDSLMTPPK